MRTENEERSMFTSVEFVILMKQSRSIYKYKLYCYLTQKGAFCSTDCSIHYQMLEKRTNKPTKILITDMIKKAPRISFPKNDKYL